MTQKDKIAFSKIYSKFNARVERYALTFFFKTLKKQVQGLSKLIDTYPIEVVPSRLNDVISEETFRNDFAEFYQKVGEKFIKFYAAQFQLSVKKDKDPLSTAVAGINIGFRDAAKIAELAKVAQSLEVADKVTKITEHTRKLIKETIERGIADNKTKPDIAKEIASKTSGAIAKKRALVIARTETTYISSKAAEINVMDSPFKLEKTWIAVSDMRTRPDHLDMIGKKAIPKDEFFSVGGVAMRYPGDPAGGAAQVCNCRCAILYAPIAEQSSTTTQTIGNSLLSSTIISQLLNELFGRN